MTWGHRPSCHFFTRKMPTLSKRGLQLVVSTILHHTKTRNPQQPHLSTTNTESLSIPSLANKNATAFDFLPTWRETASKEEDKALTPFKIEWNLQGPPTNKETHKFAFQESLKRLTISLPKDCLKISIAFLLTIALASFECFTWLRKMITEQKIQNNTFFPHILQEAKTTISWREQPLCIFYSVICWLSLYDTIINL